MSRRENRLKGDRNPSRPRFFLLDAVEFYSQNVLQIGLGTNELNFSLDAFIQRTDIQCKVSRLLIRRPGMRETSVRFRGGCPPLPKHATLRRTLRGQDTAVRVHASGKTA